jgi:hypothetical protein
VSRFWLLLLLSGCTNKVGFLLEVKTHQVSSIDRGVQKLELVMAQQSFCGRWVEDKSASHVTVDVSKRDLGKNPYTFLVEPVQATDIKAEVVPIVLARGAGGQLLGEAGFGALHWSVTDGVRQYAATLQFLSRGSQAGGPVYVADDGCVCLPGQPWMGTGSQSGCDPKVISSFDRLQDTKGCELPQGFQSLPIACDGQQYPNEVTDRQLPCFANVNGACRVDTRNCHDSDGYAYDQECVPDPAAPSLPDSTLCDAYLACERNPCGDLIGCFTQKTTPEKHFCTLRIALTNDTAMHPCADGQWLATLATTADACPAAMLDGTHQPPFNIGFRVPNQTEVQPVGSCPLQLAVDKIDADNYDQVPYSFQFFATIKNKLVLFHVDVVLGCQDAVPSLICQ